MPPPSAPPSTTLNPEGQPQAGYGYAQPMQQPPMQMQPMQQAMPMYGQPAPGQPGYGQQPAYGQPVYNQPVYGQPGYAPQVVLAPTGMVIMATGIPMEPVCPDAAWVMMNAPFACCDDCETCICGFFFPPCAFGRNGQRAGLGDCCGDCCIYYCFGHFPCLGGARRQQFYRKLRLPDPGCFATCCFVCWCRHCALAHEGRVSKLMEAHRMNPNHSPHTLSTAGVAVAVAKPNQQPITR